jgi:hypothetical protein
MTDYSAMVDKMSNSDKRATLRMIDLVHTGGFQKSDLMRFVMNLPSLHEYYFCEHFSVSEFGKQLKRARGKLDVKTCMQLFLAMQSQNYDSKTKEEL